MTPGPTIDFHYRDEQTVKAKDKEGNDLQKPTGSHPDCIDAARYALMMQLENPNRGEYHIY